MHFVPRFPKHTVQNSPKTRHFKRKIHFLVTGPSLFSRPLLSGPHSSAPTPRLCVPQEFPPDLRNLCNEDERRRGKAPSRIRSTKSELLAVNWVCENGRHTSVITLSIPQSVTVGRPLITCCCYSKIQHLLLPATR